MNPPAGAVPLAWFHIARTEDEQRTVNAERDTDVRCKMMVLWVLHHGDTRERAATVTGLGRATVQRYVRTYKDGRLDGLRRWGVTGPVSALATHSDVVRASLTANPVRTTAQTADRIEQLTGIRRQPTQSRVFLAGLGFSDARSGDPDPPKKRSPSTSRPSAGSSARN
ncbi:helix-turn-helix domain-containing protein [Gemmata obscuriglobus]|uniref:helix-turn-helix domain-containing protein n=1 Tax=Gemmata obscuriglobus TaxID=114 RepID=UPI0013A59EF8|nr:helix-turn-helix domain-containing protein [Gemmata obscuriglobus]